MKNQVAQPQNTMIFHTHCKNLHNKYGFWANIPWQTNRQTHPHLTRKEHFDLLRLCRNCQGALSASPLWEYALSNVTAVTPSGEMPISCIRAKYRSACNWAMLNPMIFVGVFSTKIASCFDSIQIVIGSTRPHYPSGKKQLPWNRRKCWEKELWTDHSPIRQQVVKMKAYKKHINRSIELQVLCPCVAYERFYAGGKAKVSKEKWTASVNSSGTFLHWNSEPCDFCGAFLGSAAGCQIIDSKVVFSSSLSASLQVVFLHLSADEAVWPFHSFLYHIFDLVFFLVP